MNRDNQKTILTFNTILTLFTTMVFINLMFGPLVRATHSGLACPDWPLCFGKIIPHYNFQVWMEFGHRAFSGTIGIILLYIIFFIYREPFLRERFLKLSILAAVLIMTQIMLGGLTIWQYLAPTVVNLHLLNGLLFFTVIVTMKVKASYLSGGKMESEMIASGFLFSQKNWMFLLTLVAVFIQIFAGGRVSSNYAGLACADFPTCNGEWFPAMVDNLVRIQMEHRYGAYITFLFIAANAFYATAKVKVKTVTIFSHSALLLIMIQILIGYLNIQFKLPKLITALHTGAAVGIFSMIYIAMLFNLISLTNQAKSP